MPPIRASSWAMAAAIALTSSAPAFAQSCVREADDTTRCRVLVASPQTVNILARAYLQRSQDRTAVTVSIAVDDRACFSRLERPGFLNGPAVGRCRLSLAPGTHVLVARVFADRPTPAVVGLQLQAEGRLSETPKPEEVRRLMR